KLPVGVVGNVEVGVIEMLKEERQVGYRGLRIKRQGLLAVLRRARALEHSDARRANGLTRHVAEQQATELLLLGQFHVLSKNEFGLALDGGVVTDDGLDEEISLAGEAAVLRAGVGERSDQDRFRIAGRLPKGGRRRAIILAPGQSLSGREQRHRERD